MARALIGGHCCAPDLPPEQGKRVNGEIGATDDCA
jgi:hypothetical protein